MHVHASHRARFVAILAGGAGARMGGEKPAARLGSHTLLSRAVEIARVAGLEPLVIARRDGPPAQAVRARVLVESPAPRHPLSGIAYALEELRVPVVALACDMPHVPPSLVAMLAALGGAPAACPTATHGIEPLIGRYSPQAAPVLRRGAARGLPAREVVRSLGPRLIGSAQLELHGDPAAYLASVNTPAELERARQLVAQPKGSIVTRAE